MADRAAAALRAWLPLLLVGAAVLTAALDHTVVVTVLPQVMPDLKVSPTELDRAAWIITAYLLGFTAAIPVTARLADIHGHARVFAASLAVFGVGSAAAALAPTLEWLVAARVVQAVGGGATIPVGMAMAVHAFPGRRRAVAVGIIGACAEAGMVLGPLYGGAITAWIGWRWVFWLDVPQAALLILLLRAFPATPRAVARMDYAGAVLLVAGLTLLVMAASMQEAFDVSSAAPYALACAGAAVVGALVWVERRAAFPLLPPAFFRTLPSLSALGVKVLVGAALLIAMVTVPLMANTALGVSPLEGGLRLMRLTGAIPVGALAGGVLCLRVGERAVVVAGLAVGAAGLLLMSGWTVDIADPALSVHLAIAGLGFGLVIAPVFVAAMATATADYQATSASLVTAARMLGMTFGMAALAAWGVGEFQSATMGLQLPLPQPGMSDADYAARLDLYQSGVTEASMALFRDFFSISAALLAAAMAPALLLGGRRRGPAATPSPPAPATPPR